MAPSIVAEGGSVRQLCEGLELRSLEPVEIAGLRAQLPGQNHLGAQGRQLLVDGRLLAGERSRDQDPA